VLIPQVEALPHPDPGHEILFGLEDCSFYDSPNLDQKLRIGLHHQQPRARPSAMLTGKPEAA
jgi:hypothetical protein